VLFLFVMVQPDEKDGSPEREASAKQQTECI
jgi:hypothetical protein